MAARPTASLWPAFVWPCAQWALGLLVALLLAACGPSSAAEQYLQGSWIFVLDQGQGYTAFQTWTFDRDRFMVIGYPPLHQSGRYRIIADDGQWLRLRLEQQQGDWGSDDTEIAIVLDRASETLRLDNQGPFTRHHEETQ